MTSHAFSYVESDVPDGMTLTGWRAAEAGPRTARRSSARRLARRVAGLTPRAR
jgi:hypothetical protein